MGHQPLIRIETLLVTTLSSDGSCVYIGGVQTVAVAQSDNVQCAGSCIAEHFQPLCWHSGTELSIQKVCIYPCVDRCCFETFTVFI